VCALVVALTLGVRPVAAGTAETMESSFLAWVNQARVARGIPALTSRADLRDLAGDRAVRLAGAGVLSHATAGCLSCQLTSRHIVWHLYGESIGWSGWPWGLEAARHLFDGFKNSPSHWSMLMSRSYDQVGVGVAYRSATGDTYISIVLIDGDPLAKPKPGTTPTPTRIAGVRVLPTLIRQELPSLVHRRDQIGRLSAGVIPGCAHHSWQRGPAARMTIAL
jgi:hypothetical protein